MGANVCKDDKLDDKKLSASAAQKTRQIDIELRRNCIEEKHTVKILLLGKYFNIKNIKKFK